MASSIKNLRGDKHTSKRLEAPKDLKPISTEEEKNMSEKEENKEDSFYDTINPGDDLGFDFVEAYDDDPAEDDERMLPENSAASAIKCAFIGVGGGGGKLAKAFLDLGFSKTILVNTTIKDQPDGVPPDHFLLIPGADGVGKDVNLGQQVLGENSALLEDALRTRIGSIDWIFVLAGGGGGTGSACSVLHNSMTRHLKSCGASGKVVYILTKPSAQELLNPTISTNYESALKGLQSHPHIVIDNERQLQLLRGKVGMLNMYPSANKNFAKLIAQVLKLSSESSPIQTFDSKDLERCLGTPGRMIVGSTISRDPSRRDLGSALFQGCIKSSPCPEPAGSIKTGAMLLVATSVMAGDPDVSKKLESALSYVGGRTETLFSGIYVNESVPGLIAISLLGGM